MEAIWKINYGVFVSRANLLLRKGRLKKKAMETDFKFSPGL